ncbi:PAS domain S-box protein [Alicyclobacillus fastidiosus]|uniref:histidine kinase n=1 Tax=Alicyclobacillus fastidiosus TaxID=392011 RepID=A0ABV5ADK4_9BACL|nr:PAS domain S-box protein [Alicyclobacillus fastidiosus]WEH08723.1 PAS domain S-box protein [Alicyclobacillus fastidiosus]
MEFQSDDKGVSVVALSNAGNVNLFMTEQRVHRMFSDLVSCVLQFDYDGCIALIHEPFDDSMRPGPGYENAPLEIRRYVDQLLQFKSLLAHVTNASGVFDLNQLDGEADMIRLLPHGEFPHKGPWLVPVSTSDHFYGCFVVYHRRRRKLTHHDVQVLALIAQHTAAALDSQHTHSFFQTYESLFRNHPFAVLRLDSGDVIRDVNRSFVRMFGWPRHQIVGQSFDKLMRQVGIDVEKIEWNAHPQEREETPEFLRQLMWVSIPITIDGAMQGRYVVFNDISRIRQMHRELRTTQDLLSSFVHHSTDPILFLEPSGIVLDVNPAFEEVFGWKADEVVSLFVADLAGIHLDRLQMAEGPVTTYETTARTRRGQQLDVDVTLSSIHDKGGRSGFVAVVRDVSDRKRAEQKQRMSEERYQSLVHHHPNAILAVDLSGRIVEANHASERILGYTLAELLRFGHVKSLFLEETHRQIENWMEQNVVQRTPHEKLPEAEFETVMQHRDGHSISVAVTWVPIITTDRGVEGAFLILEDMTERKRAEEIFRSSDKLSGVGQLAAGIAHEIRNPLTAIQGFCRLLEEGATPTQLMYLKIMKDEISRIDLIAGEMMALAKPSGALFQPYLVQDIVRDVVALMNAQALLYGVSLFVQCSDMPLLIHCDPNQVKQVLVNIIKNALEATTEGGQVHLVAEERTDVVEISVRDTGAGIPYEHLAQLGNPFFTTKERGTGLGLLVSRRIVQAHGGSLHIDSVVGQGTTVLVRLPKRRDFASS